MIVDANGLSLYLKNRTESCQWKDMTIINSVWILHTSTYSSIIYTAHGSIGFKPKQWCQCCLRPWLADSWVMVSDLCSFGWFLLPQDAHLFHKWDLFHAVTQINQHCEVTHYVLLMITSQWTIYFLPCSFYFHRITVYSTAWRYNIFPGDKCILQHNIIHTKLNLKKKKKTFQVQGAKGLTHIMSSS